MTTAELREAARTEGPTVSVTRAAQLRGVSRAAMYREIASGRCPVPVIRGARLTIPTAALLRLLGVEE
jgi:predicted DNA-binding transcriptional regulator AlpA